MQYSYFYDNGGNDLTVQLAFYVHNYRARAETVKVSSLLAIFSLKRKNVSRKRHLLVGARKYVLKVLHFSRLQSLLRLPKPFWNLVEILFCSNDDAYDTVVVQIKIYEYQYFSCELKIPVVRLIPHEPYPDYGATNNYIKLNESSTIVCFIYNFEILTQEFYLY